ncbi:MAG: DUF3419 family protein [Pseudomonadota bacterium]
MSNRITAAQLGAAVHQNPPLSRSGLSERVFSNMFKGLVYAQIWEDPAVDMAALRIGPESRLVCIASGGCNMMSYLTAGPAEVMAVDLSPAHVALNRLKLTAARVLDQATFYDLFGHANLRRNIEVYDRALAPELDPGARAFWEGRQGAMRRRIEMFARGFYRYGALGRYLTACHIASRLGGVDYRPFLAAPDMAAQAAFFENQVAPLFDKRLVRWAAGRRASLFGLGIPPQQYEKLAADGGGDIIPVLRGRMRRLMCDFPVSENYFAWAAFNRGYKPDGTGPVPPYLEAPRFEALKRNARKAMIAHRPLTDALRDLPEGSRHGYVLLDAQDWMNDAQLNALWAEITRTAVPGARVVFRTGGAPDILPGRVAEDTLAHWHYLDDASATATRNDRSAIYGGVHVYERRP